MAWDRAGRPRTEDLQISAYPKGQSVAPSPEARVLEKRWTTLVISRPLIASVDSLLSDRL
jgi:hypothetical protein